MPTRGLACTIAAVALTGCGAASSQTASAPPSAQPVALQLTTTVAKHARAPAARGAHARKRVVHTTPATAPTQTAAPAQTQTQTQTVAVTTPATATQPSPPASTGTSTNPTKPAATVHRHKKKSSGTSAGGTPVSSQGY